MNSKELKAKAEKFWEKNFKEYEMHPLYDYVDIQEALIAGAKCMSKYIKNKKF